MLRHGDGSTHTKLKAPKSNNSWIIKMNSANASQLHLSLSFVDLSPISHIRSIGRPDLPDTWPRPWGFQTPDMSRWSRCGRRGAEPSWWIYGVTTWHETSTFLIFAIRKCKKKNLQSMGSLQWFPNFMHLWSDHSFWVKAEEHVKWQVRGSGSRLPVGSQDKGPCLGVQSWALPNRTM